MVLELREKEGNCSCCKATFFAKDLDDISRCPKCHAEDAIPGTKQEQEYIMSEKQQRQKIKDMIKECLKEMKEEEQLEKQEKAYAAKKCVTCGQEFFPRAPAQKTCPDCQEKKPEVV